MIPTPPEDLMWLVTGKRDEQIFLDSGPESKRDLIDALAWHRRELTSFRSVLDFGVGAGRMARHLGEVTRLVGTDVMPELIEWCQRSIPFGSYVLNDHVPPLPFDDGEFDLIVSHSVFTHLGIAHQDLWLAELRRVLQPGGYAVLSFSGDAPFDGYLASLVTGGAADRADQHRRDFERDGYKWVEDDEWIHSSFPDWYHSMFHSPAYVLRHWSQFMKIESWKRCGNLAFLDTVVLTKS